MHDTWGHLFPTDREVHTGRVCCTIGVFGDIVVVDFEIDLDDSPWLCSSLGDHIYEELRKHPRGSLWELEIAAQVVDYEDGERIDIRTTKRTCLKTRWRS